MIEQTLFNKKHGFAQIENCVLRNPLISRTARLVYGVLVSCSFQKDSCFPGQERIAAEVGVSTRVIRDALNELRGIGLISWKQTGLNLPNLYYIEEVPTKLKDEYFNFQLKLTATINDKTKEDNKTVNDRLAKRRKKMKEEKMINTMAGRIKKNR